MFLFHTGRLGICRWVCFSLTLACGGGNGGRYEEEARNRPKSGGQGPAVGGVPGGGPGVGRRCPEKHRQVGEGQGRWKPRVAMLLGRLPLNLQSPP